MRRGLLFGVSAPFLIMIGAFGAVTTTGALTRTTGGGVPGDAVAQAVAQAPTFSETDHVSFQTPCRIIDTHALGALIGANETRNFRVRGTAGFPGQGGKEGGCTIPQSAKAITASVKVLQETAAGYLRVWPFGLPEPNPVVLYFAKNTPQSATTTLTLGGGSSAALSIRPHDGATRVIVDVWGYDVPPIAAHIAADGSIISATSRVLSSTRLNTGAYSITVDRDVTNCVVTGLSDSAFRHLRALPAHSSPKEVTIVSNLYTDISTQVQSDYDFSFVVTC